MQTTIAKTVESIPNRAQVLEVTYTPDFSAVCSVGKAPFHGTLNIVFRPSDRLLEFESFETWLRSIATRQLTIEDLCRLVFNTLTEALGDIPLCVTVDARTTVHAPARATIKRGEW